MRALPKVQSIGAHLRRRGLLLPVLAVMGLAACDRSGVVVYCSADQEYAERVFEKFTLESGIRVLPVYDTESSKTTGLYQRLRAERRRPQADVFWNAELCRTIGLADEGLAADLSGLVPPDFPKQWLDPAGHLLQGRRQVNWAAFGLRARTIVYNTRLVPADEAPRSLEELTQPRWRGQVVMANPLFGTTASHVAALYVALGPKKAESLLQRMKDNGLRLVEGNAAVRDLVAGGGAAVGLTDTDDATGGIEDGLPIAMVLPDQEDMGTFVIPNSVMLVSGGPHCEAAERFVRFLLRPEVEEILAVERGHHIPVRPGVFARPAVIEKLPFRCAEIRPMEVDYRKVAASLPETARRMEQMLLVR